MEYKPTIGLEIHIELKTKSKMFCSCKNDSLEKTPNVNICPICLGHPGTLPVINKEAVKKTIKTALALNCKIQKRCFFERKNYFYPDLPKGYQISQFEVPIGKEGFLEIGERKIRIRRVHLEEDTGKLIHPENKNYTLVDFNRAGIPLLELVTEPDISSSKEAREFVKELQLILRYLDVSGADMEKGQMRAEVNISLAEKNSQELGTKVEIKNLNSLRSVEKAIEYEIERQKEVLEAGEKVVQETRGWHDKKEITFSQREKEESHDYRYFPEPDLPPLALEEDFVEEIRVSLPELPYQKRERFKKEYYLEGKDAEVYITNRELGEYFENVVSELRNWLKEKELKEAIKEEEFKTIIKLASNYISTNLQALLKEKGVSMKSETFSITPENFAEFLMMIYKKEITSRVAKTLLKEMFERGGDPSQIIEEKGLKQITNEKEIEEAAKIVIEKNQKAVEDYKNGKEGALQFLIGQLMAQTKGKANPEMAKDLIKKLLSKS